MSKEFTKEEIQAQIENKVDYIIETYQIKNTKVFMKDLQEFEQLTITNFIITKLEKENKDNKKKKTTSYKLKKFE